MKMILIEYENRMYMWTLTYKNKAKIESKSTLAEENDFHWKDCDGGEDAKNQYKEEPKDEDDHEAVEQENEN